MNKYSGKKYQRRITAAVALLATGLLGLVQAQDDSYESDRWIPPGTDGVLPAEASYENGWGALGILNASGPVNMKDHPFFAPIGTNGRACVTCHQPADGMGLSVNTIRERWVQSGGTDPLFATIDGANCPNLPKGVESSHSLLLNRGLIRVALPWPPAPRNGVAIEPEFTIEVVRDPAGCNSDPEYGLNSEHPTVSVYRRPRVAANLKYISYESNAFNGKRLGIVNDRDPLTGKFMNMNIMSDAREPSLLTQANNAGKGHLQAANDLTQEQIEQIVTFENQIFAAQSTSKEGGILGYAGGPEALGPANMMKKERWLGDNFGTPLFVSFDMWNPAPGETGGERSFWESIARGHDVFFTRSFFISEATHINTVGLGSPAKRTCATCHNSGMVGTDLAAGWMDVGSTNLPFARESVPNPWTDVQHDLPLFKITCNERARPHPFLGREIYTQDPGRALISGRCYDVGSIVMGQVRGLAARAPYFSNGSATSLPDLVDFYDRRFNIGYTEQEKQDLANFLSVL